MLLGTELGVAYSTREKNCGLNFFLISVHLTAKYYGVVSEN